MEPGKGPRGGVELVRDDRGGSVIRPVLGIVLVLASLAASCSDPSLTEPMGLDRGPGPDPQGGPVTAFVDVNVVPMDADRTVQGQTVLVQDETIVEIGPADSVQLPDGARVVEGSGRWLMPGLVDAHTHLGTNLSEFTNRIPPQEELQEMAEGQMLLYLANGATTILNMGSFAEPVLQWRSDVIEGLYPGPTIYASHWLRGPPGTPDGGPGIFAPTTPDEARAWVRETANSGYHFLKLYNWPSKAVVLAAMDEANTQGLAIAGHFPHTLPVQETLASGMDLVAHAEAYLWTFFHYGVSDELVPDAVAMTQGAGASVATTLGVTKWEAAVWGGNQAGIDAFWALPEVRYMHASEVGLHKEGLDGTRWNPAGAGPGDYDARYQFVLRYTREFYDAGIRLLAGTDSPTVLGAAGFSLLRELDILQQQLNLSPYQVLELATGNPGDFVDEYVPEASRFGRVQAGWRADLLLLNGDPLASLDNVRDRVAVMARGRLYTEDELQAGLKELAARYVGNGG